MRVRLVCGWAGDGLTPETAFRAAVAAVPGTDTRRYLDTFDGRRNPNLVVVEVDCTAAVRDAIRTDPVFGPGVLFAQGVRDDAAALTAAEATAIAARLVALGVSAVAAAAATDRTDAPTRATAARRVRAVIDAGAVRPAR